MLLGVESMLGLPVGIFTGRLLGADRGSGNSPGPVEVGGAVLTMALLGSASVRRSSLASTLSSIRPNSCTKSEAAGRVRLVMIMALGGCGPARRYRMDASSIARHGVELRLLRYVIAVAEELHFGRAAKRLHLSAPALSKQIKDLECDLGYVLFERRTREVLLTPAGTAFVVEARQALLQVERAVECGYAASRGDTGVLSLGYSPWFRPSLLVTLRSAFAEKAAGTRLALYSAYSTTQIDLLLKGTLHAGVIELPADGDGLETQRIWHEELVVAVPENHSIATRSEIDRRDLSNEPIIGFAKFLNSALHRYLIESCQRSDCAPLIIHEVNTVSELLDLVGTGSGIGFVQRSIAERFRVPGVIFRELSGPKLFIDTGVAYRADNRSEALRALIQLLREPSS